MKYFVSAAANLNFTKAARECGVVQAAMTQQMANLEKELGVKLFVRKNRGIALTPAGDLFLQDAREILAGVWRSQERIGAFRAGYDAILRIGFHGELCKADLPQILRDFRAAAPGVKVMLSQETRSRLLSGLEDRRLDLVFSLEHLFTDREKGLFAWDVLDREEVYLALPVDHPLAAREQVAMAEVVDLPLVGFGEPSLEEWHIRMNRPVGEPRGYGRFQDHTSIQLLIESGYGVGIWTRRMCQKGAYPNLCFVPIADFPYQKETLLIRRQGDLSPAARTFRSLAVDHYKKDG